MTGKSHLATGISSAIITTNALIYIGYTYTGWQASALSKVARYTLEECAGSHSNINRIVWFVFSILLFLFGLILPDIDKDTSMVSKLLHFHIPIEHRTWTHTIWVVISLSVLAVFFRPCIFLSLGYLVHLFWDGLSSCGVCLFYPFEKYRSYGKAKVKEKHILKFYHTSKASEYVLLGITLTLTIAMCIWFVNEGFYSNALRAVYGK